MKLKEKIPFLTFTLGLILTLALTRAAYNQDKAQFSTRLSVLNQIWSAYFTPHETYFNYLHNELTTFFKDPTHHHASDKQIKALTRNLFEFCGKTFQKSTCIYLDKNGTAIDSSFDDIVGVNFQERPYFQQAMQHQTGHMIAVGLVTEVPGAYTAKPIYNAKNEIEGVLVFKINLLWIDPIPTPDEQFLIDSNGVILASNKKHYVQHSLKPIDKNLADELVRKHIFRFVSEPVLKHDGVWTLSGFWPTRVFTLELPQFPGLSFVILGPLRNSVSAFLLGFWTTLFLTALTYILMRWNTSLHKYKDRMVVSDRMASIGNLASGLAHEINNPLVLLKYNVSLFRELASEDLLKGKFGQALHKQDEAIERVANIVRALQEYTRLSSDASGAVDVHEAIKTTLVLVLKVYAKEQIFITEKLEAKDVWIEGNSAKLVQTFMSLLSFFKELRSDSDMVRQVSIETKNDKSKLTVLFKERDTQVEAVEIQRIFEPFFPIRSLGRHSLAPYIAYSLIHQMNGEAKAYIEDKNLCIVMEFPFIPYSA